VQAQPDAFGVGTLSFPYKRWISFPNRTRKLTKKEKEMLKTWQAFTDKEWAVWAAAWIDAEGHIWADGPLYNYRIQLAVDNSYLEPLKLLASHFGGHIYRVKASRTSMSKAPYNWRWQAEGRDVSRIMKEVFPYLIIKKERAAPIYYVLSSFHTPPRGQRRTEGEYRVGRTIYGMMRHRPNKPELIASE